MRAMLYVDQALDRMATRAKLLFGFLLASLLSGVLGVVALSSLADVNGASASLASQWLPAVGNLARARAAMLEAREFEVKYSTAPDSSYLAEYLDKIKPQQQAVLEQMQAYDQHLAPEPASELRRKFTERWKAYLTVHAKVVALGQQGKLEDAKDISEGAGKSEFDDSLLAIDKLTEESFASSAEVAAHAESTYLASRRVVLGVLVLAVVSAVAMALLLTRNILGQLGGEPKVAARYLQAIADGDLTCSIPLRAGDSHSLMASLDQMQQGLARVVNAVREGSEGVATASSEIAMGNSDLSGRTELQASALQQTAASMDQLGSTVNLNAENARQANQMARQASLVAEKGGSAVGEVVSLMRSINESSRRISDITGVIDGIAFQTNILALNAAVEAARAGEQGRGFAVVAAEVRSLAQRSANAAKEIKSLITTSGEQIESGGIQVDRAGQTMQEVVSSIQQVTTIVHEIAQASAEQSRGVQQVGEAITQMDQATQQNAALVEESAAAAESLRSQAQSLVQSVSVFKTLR